MHPVADSPSKHADSSLPFVHSVPIEGALVPSLGPWYQSNLNTLVLFSFELPVYLDTWVHSVLSGQTICESCGLGRLSNQLP